MVAVNHLLTSLSSIKFTGCDLSNAVLQVPAGQSLLVSPTTAPSFIGLGVGVQNYTCASTSTYTNVGAVAELFDISCLYNTPVFSTIQNDAFAGYSDLPSEFTAFDLISLFHDSPFVLGQHYFITNPVTGTGLSPKWDFTSAKFKGNPNAYVVGAKVGDIPSPDDTTTDVDWLALKDVEGDLATQVFRVGTDGGQPPSSCTPGTSPELSVKYTAQYWLYGSTVTETPSTPSVHRHH